VNLTLRKTGTLVICLLAVLALEAAVLAWRGLGAVGSQSLALGRRVSVEVTPAQGGVLDLGDMGVLRIPPGAVDHRGKLHASIGGEDAPPPDDWLVPIGPSIKIDLIGARLTGDVDIELAIRPPPPPSSSSSSSSSAGSLTPVAMVFDDVQHRWLKDESSSYDSASGRSVVHARHFSWWQAFTWDWDWTRRMAHSIVEGTFNGLIGDSGG
jgi:hypothetical protein